MIVKHLYLILFLLISIQNKSKSISNYKNRLLQLINQPIPSITCNKKGVCLRSDETKLKIGWIPIFQMKTKTEQFSVTFNQTIISIDPFKGAVSFQFLVNSQNYTCADGVEECYNSCCNSGYCTDPSNLCTSAFKSSISIIYGTCIGFVLLSIGYWIVFAMIGVKYSKKRAKVYMVNKEKDLKDVKDVKDVKETYQEGKELNISKSILENFDEIFNKQIKDENINLEIDVDEKVVEENPILNIVLEEERNEEKVRNC